MPPSHRFRAKPFEPSAVAALIERALVTRKEGPLQLEVLRSQREVKPDGGGPSLAEVERRLPAG